MSLIKEVSLKKTHINPIIISNNCWGGLVYKHFQTMYHSPYVNLYFKSEDYIKVLSDLYETTFSPVKFEMIYNLHEKRSYPVGIMKNDAIMHFVHSSDPRKVSESWLRRCERAHSVWDPKRILVKYCDRDGFKDSFMHIFHSLPFENKVSFSVKDFNYKGHYKICGFDNMCPEGHKLFEITKHIHELKLIYEL